MANYPFPLPGLHTIAKATIGTELVAIETVASERSQSVGAVLFTARNAQGTLINICNLKQKSLKNSASHV